MKLRPEGDPKAFLPVLEKVAKAMAWEDLTWVTCIALFVLHS